MPRTLRALLVVVVALLAWNGFHAALRYRLVIALETGRQPRPLEEAFFSADTWVSRWLVLGLSPVLLAPEGAVVLWALLSRRASHVPPSGHVARAELRVWAIVLAAALALGAVSALWSLWSASHSAVMLGLTALFAFSWSYAGALRAALWLQKARNEAGLSSFRAWQMALIAFLVAACAPLHFFGAAIPVWLLWASRAQAKA